MINMLNPALANEPLFEELEAEVSKIIRGGQYIMGPAVSRFETAVAKYLDVNHAVAVSSGTDALLLAMMAYDIGPGDEVICPSFTFFATAGSISRLGATPIFVDNNPHSFNIDPNLIKSAITDRTKAIMPVHLFGQSAEMDAILDIAGEHALIIIEDACQAIGTTYKNKKVGTLANAGCYSFFPSKNLGGFGDAGLVVTNDDATAKKMTSLRNHGSSVKYHHDYIGANFRIDTIQAALLEIKLRHLDRDTEKRQANAELYNARLTNAKISNQITTPRIAEIGHTFNQYTIKVKGGRRDKLQNYLNDNHVSTAVYYPIPLHAQRCYDAHTAGHFPHAMACAAECLSIPIAPEVTKEEVSIVADLIVDFAERCW